TSSGANKSGRLFLARSLAEKSHDTATLGFVSRRFVEVHLETDMTDWAVATLRGTKLDTAKDSEAMTLAARTYRALRIEPLAIQSMRDLTAAFRADPQKVPDGLLFSLSSVARTHDPRIWVAATTELARRGIRGEILVDAMSTKSKDDVVRAAKDAFVGGMDDADE